MMPNEMSSFAAYLIFCQLQQLKGQFTQEWKFCHHLLILKVL